MNKLFVCLSCMFMLCFLIACDNKGSARKNMVAVAESRPAPEISVQALDGSMASLSQFKGKVVLLNFWATWCPPCREEIPSMVKLNSIMNGKPFQMMAVSIDEGGKAAVESFFKANGVTLPAYLDQLGTAVKVYGITGVPETFIIDRNGNLVKKVIGPLKWDDQEVVTFLNNLMK